MAVVRRCAPRRRTAAATAAALAFATVVAFVTAPSASASHRGLLTHRPASASASALGLIGGITGRVTDARGRGLGRVCVAALNAGMIRGAAVTGTAGTYVIGAVRAGRYQLRFASCASSSSSALYDPDWYRTARSGTMRAEVVVRAGRETRADDVLFKSAAGSPFAIRANSAPSRRRPVVSTASVGSISGTVTDSSGHGLAGICVEVDGVLPTIGGGFGSTLAGGGYTVTGLSSGTYDVEFMPGADCGNTGNFLPQWFKGQPSQATATPVKVAGGATKAGINARLLAGGTISGKVTNVAGKAFPDVFVQAQGAGIGFGSARTLSNGTYTIVGLAADTYTVSFEASSDNYLQQWYKGQPTVSTATPVPLTTGEAVSGINAKMLPGGIIAGRVTNMSGEVLAGICVEVRAVGEGGAFFSTSATTLANGRYSIPMVPAGIYAVGFSNCSDKRANYAPQWSGGSATYSSAEGVAVRGAKTTQGVNAKMPAGGSISGRVTSTKGRPLKGICISTSSQNGSTGSATTSADGSYSVFNLPTGAYTVTFCGNTAGYVSQSYDDDLANPVSVVAGQTSAHVNASLVLGGKISGHVTNTAGRSLSGICVEASGQTPGSAAGSTATVSNGEYSIAGLTTGSYAVDFFSGCANKTSYETEWYRGKFSLAAATKVKVTDGRTTKGVGVSMHLAGTISGMVTDTGTTPLPGICVTIVNAAADGGGGSSSTVGDGSYSVSGLSTGTYFVDFTPDCGTTGNYSAQWYKDRLSQRTATAVRVTAGRTTPGIDAMLPTGGSIAGKVTDSAGNALRGICISVNGANTFGAATTTGTGSYAVDDLGTGDYTVSFATGCGNSSDLLAQWYRGKASLAAASVVHVTAGKSTPGVDARMISGGTITGTVTNAAGPMLGACVSVVGPLDSGSAATSITGRYTVTGLGPGRYTVSASTNDCSNVNLGNYLTWWYRSTSSAAAATRVTVSAGSSTAGVDMEVPADGVVSGLVSASSNGAKLTGICVEADNTTSPGPYEVAITIDGRYQLVEMSPGSYEIEFVAGCGSTGRFASQWYHAKHSASSATLLRVRAGQSTGGIDAKLLP
jgi:hypothetical protein